MVLSIITINYNDADALKQTIDSVLNQTWKDFEYIIIDGGSKDESVDVIKANEQHIAYWVSEKDKGVFNAMNKGIPHAKGDYLLMLNAGDYLADHTVLEKVFGIPNPPTEEIIACDVYRSDGNRIFDTSVFPEKITFDFFRKGSLSHQGTFIKRTLHDTIGLYDESLKFSADRKFLMIACCKVMASYKHVPVILSVCDTTGLTCTPSNFDAMDNEMNKVMAENFAPFVDDYVEKDKLIAGKFSNRVKTAEEQLKSVIKKIIRK